MPPKTPITVAYGYRVTFRRRRIAGGVAGRAAAAGFGIEAVLNLRGFDGDQGFRAAQGQ